MTVSIGDEVRVHYHPPGLTMSFAEGVVSRVDVSTLRGRMFVIDVTYEVILDREQRIGPGFRSYVLYERPEDFPGRIEVISPRQENAEKSALPAVMDEADRLTVEVERQDNRPKGTLISALFGRPK